MKNIAKTPSAFFIRCTVLVFCLAFAQRIWADCHLTVTLSGATGDVIVAGDDNKASLAITANPVLTRDEGEQRELVNGECGEGSYTFNWSPQPSSTSHSGGAGFLLQPGVHTISCTVTYQDECCRSTATGSCTVEVVQSCKNRKSDVTETVRGVLPPIATPFADSMATLAKQLPFCTDASIKIEAGVEVEKGEMCCNGTADTASDPVEYSKLTGDIGATVSASFAIPGTAGRKRIVNDTYVPIRLSFRYLLGPEVTVGPSASFSVSGTMSDCGTCLEVSGGVEFALRIECGATATANARVFEEGHWYSINETVEVTLVGYGETSAGVNGTYRAGDGCGEDTGWSGVEPFMGAINLGIAASATVGEWGVSVTFNREIYGGTGN